MLDIERVVLPFYWPTDELTDQLTDRLTYLHADVFRLAARAAHRLVNHRLGVRQRDPLAARACAQDERAHRGGHAHLRVEGRDIQRLGLGLGLGLG